MMESFLLFATPLELLLQTRTQNSVTALLTCILAVLACSSFINYGKTKKTSKLRSQRELPSPPSLPFIGHAFLIAWSGDLLKFITAMFSKHGKIWRAKFLRQDYVVIADANMVQKLFNSPVPNIDRTNLGSTIFNMGKFKGGILGLQGEVWKSHRKVLSEAFAFNSLKGYVALINSHAESLVKELRTHPLDFSELIHNSALHLITDVVFGPEICKDKDEGTKFLQLTKRLLKLISIRLANPFLLLEPLWKIHPAGRELTAVNKELDTIVSKKLKSFQQTQSVTPDNDISEIDIDSVTAKAPFHSILETLLRSGMSSDTILAQCLTMLIAGHETVSKSLELLMLNLARNPRYQDICRKEIDQVAENESENRISMNSLSELKYLEQCIKESIRLTPAVPILSRKIKSHLNLDDDIGLNVGTNVVVSLWTLHRDPQYFPNPDQFDPERFSVDNSKSMHPYAYLPFGAGRRNCIGWKMAMMELKIFSAWILRHYEVDTTDKLEDLSFRYGVSINWNRKMNLVFKQRK